MAELTDLDINKLLAEAEVRLSAKANTQSLVSVEQVSDAVAPPADKAKHEDDAKKDLSGKPAAEQPQKSANEVSLRIPEPPKKKNKKELPDTAGRDWYNLPRTQLTDELKRDLQLLRMRDVVAGGKQFFKKDNTRKMIPDYCAVGTLIEGNTDGVSGRLTRKERKRTIVEEVLSSTDSTKFKKKYGNIQEKKMSGKKSFYKKLVAGRRRKG